MRTEPPGERLARRLATPAADPDARADHDPDTDPDSLLPRWLPDGPMGDGLLAKVRADPGRAGAVALAVIAVVAVLITVFTVLRDRPAPVVSANLPAVEMVSATSSRDSPGPSPGAEQVVVSVVGLVHHPGLATLPPGARIADALTAAGGLLDGADTVGLNLARQLADGEQIVVGIAAPPGQRAALGSSVTAGAAANPGPADAAAAPRTSSTSTAARPAGPVNLNTATVEQLDALPGVGPVTAAAIVAWRDAHGKFTSIEQLGEVDGIGPGRLEKLRALVRI